VTLSHARPDAVRDHLSGRDAAGEHDGSGDDDAAAAAAPEGEPSAKRARPAPAKAALAPGVTPADALNDQVTPLWRQPYAAQLETKAADMRAALVKVGRSLAAPQPAWAKAHMRAAGGLVCPLAAVAPSPVLTAYRNKCEFTFGRDPAGAVTCGFLLGAWSEGTVTVVAPTECMHVPAAAVACAAAFEQLARTSGLPVYDRVAHTGLWRGVMVRTTAAGAVMAVVMVAPGADPAARAAVDALLLAHFQPAAATAVALACLVRQCNHSKSGSFEAGEDSAVLLGEPVLHETMAGLRFRISPSAFFQGAAWGLGDTEPWANCMQ
jgi:tRNA (uracil-5-)-methyltransferase